MAKYTPCLNDSCFFTGAHKSRCEVHHIFYGPYRQLSEKWGMKVYVIPDKHKFKKGSIHMDSEVSQAVKEFGQRQFELKHGHELFMEIFDKNYLDPAEWVFATPPWEDN